jgi:hypothetical protein
MKEKDSRAGTAGWRAEPRKGPGHAGDNPAPYGARLAGGQKKRPALAIPCERPAGIVVA